MTDLIDRADVERVLRDPRFTVPEASAEARRPMGRLRSGASRFANGSTHERRRAHLVDLLGLLDARRLEADAAARTRALVAGTPRARLDVPGIARTVPVACLAGQLGFAEPDEAPRLVAEAAEAYANGTESDAADEAVLRLLATAPRRAGGDADGVGHDNDAELRVQLLVQAYAATAALVEGAMRRVATGAATATTAELLEATLRDDPPVRLTRRVDPDGAVVVLRFDGADRDSGRGRPPRTLAFGAGSRACPARATAVAIAGAIVEEVRAC
ncbi:cytochrome P450 [Agromyces ramosus]|uniref:Cytochrome P450 n=1 Tax=Agromyces ramosus TaxID=33879 RepID=A0A4Q7MEZ7_9MICO|nr:hypothetical protein [Agromyces ramosus]RZS66591.1 cytochrome P450 [Agromyces ramosus]